MAGFELYRYNPTLVGAVIFLVLFAVMTILHLVKIIRHKSTYFIPFTIGGLFEVIGYIGRAMGHYDKTSIPAYTMQSLFILLAPALFAASIYMILGRLIRTVRAESISPIKVTRLTKVFVFGDCLSFLMQCSGGGMMASSSSMRDIGEKVILIGLFVQIFFFSIFMIVSVIFHRRLSTNPTSVSLSGAVPWKQYMHVLYTTSLLILIRSIFRVIEYAQGNDGYLISHEAFLYIFDAVFMAAVMAIFLIRYVDHLESKEASLRSEIPGSNDLILDEMEEHRTKYRA